jgi:hypothetical protein
MRSAWWQQVKTAMDEIDYWSVAEQMRKSHGEDAAIWSAMRADAALDEGDMPGFQNWKRIAKCVGELDRKTPEAGEPLN